jgi:Bifunctional DNA primase/polymerase, N-terminal/Primase C terminal 1 (PriCT-1)
VQQSDTEGGYDFCADLLEYAEYYALRGWPVFPLHSPRREPRATCDCPDGNACKRSPSKHPRTRNGLSDATTDLAVLGRWWRMWPRANVGIAVPPGYVVLDLDGPDALDALAERGWAIPPTLSASTARGWHYWFMAQVEVRPGSDFLPHVDLKGPGGYVVAPPSLHSTGVQYAWEAEVANAPIAPAPEWLFEMIREARERRRREPAAADGGELHEGSRNDALARFAGFVRHSPYGCPEAILAALVVINDRFCVPPCDYEELVQIANSVGRYAPERIAGSIWEREPW